MAAAGGSTGYRGQHSLAGRRSRIQVARATATACPPAVNSAEPAMILRPSVASRQPTTTCGSPAVTGPSSRADSRPSTYGWQLNESPAAPMPPAQSSAAHKNSGRMVPSECASPGLGCQTSADRSRPATRPTMMRSPSPGLRSGPHTKQVGKGCSDGKKRRRLLAPAALATWIETGLGGSVATPPGTRTPSATRSGPSSTRTEPSSPRSTARSVASGAGRRRVTSAGPSTWAAMSPHR